VQSVGFCEASKVHKQRIKEIRRRGLGRGRRAQDDESEKRKTRFANCTACLGNFTGWLWISLSELESTSAFPVQIPVSLLFLSFPQFIPAQQPSKVLAFGQFCLLASCEYPTIGNSASIRSISYFSYHVQPNTRFTLSPSCPSHLR